MAITVNTNVFSLNAQRNVNRSQSGLQTAMQRLSSGLRINMAKDDAAGLAVASRMESQARGFAVAQRTIADGISYLQVADNGARTITDSLQRMRELVVQRTSGTLTAQDKSLIKLEMSQLNTEIGAQTGRATFNGIAVNQGGTANIVVDGAGGTLAVALSDLQGADMADGGAATLASIDAGITCVAIALGTIGAFQSRLDKAMDNAMAVEEAQWASRGRIVDADFARETARMSSSQVILQAGISALSQANTMPQMALGLLQ